MPPTISCMSSNERPTISRSCSTTAAFMFDSRKLITPYSSMAPSLKPRSARNSRIENWSNSASSASSDPWPPCCVALPELARRLVPELRPGLAALVVGELEGQPIGVGIGLGVGHALAVDEDERLGIAHHERPHLQAEQLAVGERQVVHARDAHRARLGVQPRRKVADRLDPAADAMLCLEDERVVALAAAARTRPRGRRCRRR